LRALSSYPFRSLLILGWLFFSAAFAHIVGERWLTASGNHPLVAQWNQLVDSHADFSTQHKLKQVNHFFNRNLRYGEDSEIWRSNDYWATPLESMLLGRADCEDYAIAKYMTLKVLGVPTEQLRLIYVRAKMGGAHSPISQAHMVLGFYATPTSAPLILDNLVDDVMPADQRPDLTPVFSFNDAGLWTGNATTPAASATERLSRWRDLLAKMQQEGYE
jgi:predicted transglutaminase-like cysteine proteinase